MATPNSNDDHSVASTAYTTVQVAISRSAVQRIKQSPSIKGALPIKDGILKLTTDSISLLQQQIDASSRSAESKTSSSRQVRALLFAWRKHNLHSAVAEGLNSDDCETCLCKFCVEFRDFGRLLESRLGCKVRLAYIPDEDAESWVRKQIRFFFDWKPTAGSGDVAPFSIIYYSGHGGMSNTKFSWSSG